MKFKIVKSEEEAKKLEEEGWEIYAILDDEYHLWKRR